MNALKKILYTISRNYVKIHLTGNLGKVIEDDEKITCYVKKNKIKKKNYKYNITCFGIGENQKKIAEAYKLNKPICYVIDSLEFKKHNVYIFGYNNCEVIIKHCNFELNLFISVNGKCILDNTNIKTFSCLSIGANELIIKNMNSDQIDVISSKSNIGFSANDRIDIIDSNIGSQNKNIEVSFLAINELNIVNSNIYGKQVVCKSNRINANENSSLNATNKITLKADDFDSININVPTIILNGVLYKNEKKSVILKKRDKTLEIKKLELINLLEKVKNKCKSINSEKILEYQEELNTQPISKVLKK